MKTKKYDNNDEIWNNLDEFGIPHVDIENIIKKLDREEKEEEMKDGVGGVEPPAKTRSPEETAELLHHILRAEELKKKGFNMTRNESIEYNRLLGRIAELQDDKEAQERSYRINLDIVRHFKEANHYTIEDLLPICIEKGISENEARRIIETLGKEEEESAPAARGPRRR